MKLLCVFNFASHYRAPIYMSIDKEFDSDFVVGETNTDVKEMDLRLFSHRVTKLRCYSIGSVLFMKGKPRLIHGAYDTFLLSADIRDLSTWLFLIRKALFHRKKKVFLWGHGELGKENAVKQIMYRFFYSMSDGGFIYNERSVKLMKERGVLYPDLYTIYNSLDYDKQLPLRDSLSVSSVYQDHFANTNKNIVFIGRLTKVKRFDLLIEAVAILKIQGLFVNVTFIGDGVEKDDIQHMVERQGLIDQVWFYGACYDERINAELIYNADLCVSPGNIGLTAMHVMMFGCPAITNDDFDHQMPEFEAIQEGKTGGFFKAGDSYSLADAISKWLINHSEDRDIVRETCYQEIDLKWNPHNQIRIFKKVLLT